MATKRFSTILLVVLVASQCTATPSLPEIVNKVIDAVKGEIQKLESIAKTVEQEMQGELQKVISQVKDKLQEVEKELKDEMKTISENSAKVIHCITAERDNITSIYTNAEKQGQMCFLKAFLKMLPLTNNVKATIEEVKKNVNQVITDLQKPECTGKLQASINCLISEIPKVKQDLQHLTKEVQAEVQQAEEVAPQVVQIGQECVQKIVQDSTNEMKAIFNEVKSCIMGQ